MKGDDEKRERGGYRQISTFAEHANFDRLRNAGLVGSCYQEYNYNVGLVVDTQKSGLVIVCNFKTN